MHKCYIAVLALVMLAGCGPASNGGKSGMNGKDDGGVDIKWPGGSVKFDPDKGVEVQAGGTEVQAQPGKQVKVKTPNTDVDVQLEKQ